MIKCAGLKTAWTNMVADKEFPVTVGTVLTLSCMEGYRLTGDKVVTCTKDTEFQYTTEPQCGECQTEVKYSQYLLFSLINNDI